MAFYTWNVDNMGHRCFVIVSRHVPCGAPAGHKKLNSACSEDKDCCSQNCANIGNATVTKNVCEYHCATSGVMKLSVMLLCLTLLCTHLLPVQTAHALETLLWL